MRRSPSKVRAAAVAGVVALTLAGCGVDFHVGARKPYAPGTYGGGSQVPSSAVPSPYPVPSPAVGADGERDRTQWPYSPLSPWNYPIGDHAHIERAHLTAPLDRTLALEEDIIVTSPDAPLRKVYVTGAGWASSATRCGDHTDQVLAADVPVPEGWFTDPGYVGGTPNQAAAILLRNGEVLETQPFHSCSDGTLVSQYAPAKWQGGDLDAVGTGPLAYLTGGGVGGGAHGGSGMTAMGGTIRLGEWTPGKSEIPHTLKIDLWAHRYLSNTLNGYRWPASMADSDFLTRYGGSDPELRMGALLALPPNFRVDLLRTQAAQILARTLIDHGAYVVDDTNRDAIAFATQWGPAGRVADEFKTDWGFSLDGNLPDASGEQADFLQDMVDIYTHLGVVTDNAPGSVGGAGARLAPLAPPLAPLSK